MGAFASTSARAASNCFVNRLGTALIPPPESCRTFFPNSINSSSDIKRCVNSMAFVWAGVEKQRLGSAVAIAVIFFELWFLRRHVTVPTDRQD